MTPTDAPRLTPYQESIREFVPDVDPRHVEAYLRLEYGTLDHLGGGDFVRAARKCALAAKADPEQAEELARSYGL